ncbi:MAG: aspartate aminotransferase family protein [Parcubacteria group bacterium]|nr:aspartate aminotransferase family protein [Parcubacteria group bacterium]
MDIEQLRELQNRYLSPWDKQYYEHSIDLERGKGVLVRDGRGKKYIDCFGGVLTTSVGHGHPKVTEAVIRQLKTGMIHTSTVYLHEARVRLAQKLAEITPDGLQKSYFTPSGGEATDRAIQMAMMATGNTDIISLCHGYHGQTLLGKQLVGQKTWRELPSLVAGVKHAPHPYCFRCSFGHKYPGCGMECAHYVQELINTTTEGRIAAFIAEPVAGIGGIIPVPKEYFEIVVPIIHAHGGFFICDEVQTGVGRLGETMWGIEQWGVEPDIMTMAKGIANGFPLGVTIAQPEIANAVRGLNFATYGGNPFSCAAALATLQAIEDEGLMENAERVGKILREKLCEFLDTYGFVGDVRGWGLMQSIEFIKEGDEPNKPAPETAAQFMESCRERGLLIGRGGLYGNCIRIGPPLCITEEEIRQVLEVMEQALRAVRAGVL